MGEEKQSHREYLMLALNAQIVDLISTIWGVSSAGRAPALQAGGHRFDPGTLHQEIDWNSLKDEFHWVSWKRDSNDAPWKLNIVIIDAIYEKATVKENFLINF